MKMQKLVLSFYLFLSIIISANAQVSPGTYTITNKNSNLCLAIKGATRNNGEEGTQWTCDGGADKNWNLIDAGNGYFKIQNQNSNLFLAVGGGARDNGGRCIQYVDQGQQDIQWRFIDAGAGWYKIQNKNSGLFLAIGAGSRTGGADLIQWGDEGQEDLKWKLTSDALRITGGNFRFIPVDTRPQNKGTKLQVFIQCGSDDLRHYNTAYLTINFTNGLTSREYLLQRGLRQNQPANPTIDLDQEIDLANVRSISIRHDGTPFVESSNPFKLFDTYDNWDLMTLQIALIKHDGNLKNIYNNLFSTNGGDRVPIRFTGEKRIGEFMKQP